MSNDLMKIRTERAEAQSADLREQRDTALAELRKIRKTINADPNEATTDEVDRVVRQMESMRLDCDEALTAQQTAERERDELRAANATLTAERDAALETIKRLDYSLAQIVINSVRMP